MTTDELIEKYRRHWLGFLGDTWAIRKHAPSDFGMVMDRHICAMDAIVRAMVNDILRDPDLITNVEKLKAAERQPITNGKAISRLN